MSDGTIAEHWGMGDIAGVLAQLKGQRRIFEGSCSYCQIGLVVSFDEDSRATSRASLALLIGARLSKEGIPCET